MPRERTWIGAGRRVGGVSGSSMLKAVSVLDFTAWNFGLG